MKTLAILLVIFLVVGCASDGVPLGVAVDKVSLRAYDGAELPPSKLALLKPVAALSVVDVDGKFPLNAKTYAHGFRYVDYEIAVLPGPHTVQLVFVHGGLTSKAPIHLPIEVRAGRRYLIKEGLRNAL